MISRLFQVRSWLVFFVFALAFACPADAQRQPSRSPHGPLNIPCENCHTSTSWTPIRGIPEFNHDSTRYPLRGMHEKVYCTECHLKPVFTDVGKNCADCHADIHRRQNGANCAECHTSWAGRYRFNRSRITSTDFRSSVRTPWWNARNATRTPQSDNTWDSRLPARPAT